MADQCAEQVAVIFVSQRRPGDDVAYSRAAADMDRLAACQPGYIRIDSVRAPDGAGITVSYWADEAAARAWRDNPDHIRIRQSGRGRWYDSYSITVARIIRAYDWRRG
ncbi:antibiotic biosynthesis monooxygenase [Stakelama sp. CBK3Z-3]|uniref:Antibiotic biosynthesis monooxygenase n=1 Tax=Stakelama flava TaxID=2860338 RepID=A0ABS6XKM0_9SPHN|nr:antibiotic biosynthesis monooxygenase [Stakelama flava]MBW4330746.1 antibiotic biosynthesis monooxygenase [Stakelama flava]